MALHTQMIQLGQDRGEIRNDLPAAEIAHVFSPKLFSARLLIWSLYGDAHLAFPGSRLPLNLLWTGLAPRGNSTAPLRVPLFHLWRLVS